MPVTCVTVTGLLVMTWPTDVCVASSPGSSTLMTQSPWVTIPASIVVDDQHRPDPVIAHLAAGLDDHVAGTNMGQGTNLLSQTAFTVPIYRLPWALAYPVLMVRIEG
jgi:hypothetical protein